jgi:hypothetical protein
MPAFVCSGKRLTGSINEWEERQAALQVPVYDPGEESKLAISVDPQRILRDNDREKGKNLKMTGTYRYFSTSLEDF